MRSSRRKFVSQAVLFSGAMLLRNGFNGLFANQVHWGVKADWNLFCAGLNAVPVSGLWLPADLQAASSPVAGQDLQAGKIVKFFTCNGKRVLAQPVWIAWPGISPAPVDLLVHIYDGESFEKIITLNHYEIAHLALEKHGFATYLREIMEGRNNGRAYSVITRISANSFAKTSKPVVSIS